MATLLRVPAGQTIAFFSASNAASATISRGAFALQIVDGTTLNLNSTGLGVGMAPSYALDVLGFANASSGFKVGGTTIMASDRVLTNVVDGYFSGLVSVSSYLTIGSNVATGGTLRLGNTSGIVGRNAANTADVPMIVVTTSDRVEIGTSSYHASVPGRLYVSSYAYFSSYVYGSNGANADLLLLPGTQNGTISIKDYNTAANIAVFKSSDKSTTLYGLLALAATGTTDSLILAGKSSLAYWQLHVRADGLHEWGDGNSARDTNFYRSGASTLRTDGAFTAGAALSAGGDLTFTGGGAGPRKIVATFGDLWMQNTGVVTLHADSDNDAGGAGGNLLVLQKGLPGSPMSLLIVNNSGTLNVTPLYVHPATAAGDLYGQKIKFTIDYTSGSALSSIHSLYVQTPVRSVGTNNVNNTRGVEVENQSMAAGGTGVAAGVYVQDQVGGTASAKYGIVVEGADTAVLWLGSGADNTDAANGIVFGLSRDTNLYRSGANNLRTDDALDVVGQLTLAPGSYGNPVLAVRVSGETKDRFMMDGTGQMNWGPGGSTSTDTTLYRSTVNTLKTGGDFVVTAGLTIGTNNTSTTNVPVRLYSTTLTATAASITISSIPSGYSALQIVITCRGNSGNPLDNLLLRFNGDTGANYDMVYNGGNYQEGQTTLWVGYCVGGSTNPAEAASTDIVIPIYSKTTFYKTLLARAGHRTGSVAPAVYVFHGHWRNTSAITSITLFPSSGSFVAGTTVTVYGIT